MLVQGESWLHGALEKMPRDKGGGNLAEYTADLLHSAHTWNKVST